MNASEFYKIRGRILQEELKFDWIDFTWNGNTLFWIQSGLELELIECKKNNTDKEVPQDMEERILLLKYLQMWLRRFSDDYEATKKLAFLEHQTNLHQENEITELKKRIEVLTKQMQPL